MGTYIGIPEDISGSKKKMFAFQKERLHNRIKGWTCRWLTKGGKEVLIKVYPIGSTYLCNVDYASTIEEM